MSWSISGVIPVKALIAAPAMAAWALTCACLLAGLLLGAGARRLRQIAPVSAAIVLRRLDLPRLLAMPALSIRTSRLFDAPSRAPPDLLWRTRLVVLLRALLAALPTVDSSSSPS